MVLKITSEEPLYEKLRAALTELDVEDMLYVNHAFVDTAIT